jgi:hypothetical protein
MTNGRKIRLRDPTEDPTSSTAYNPARASRSLTAQSRDREKMGSTGPVGLTLGRTLNVLPPAKSDDFGFRRCPLPRMAVGSGQWITGKLCRGSSPVSPRSRSRAAAGCSAQGRDSYVNDPRFQYPGNASKV